MTDRFRLKAVIQMLPGSVERTTANALEADVQVVELFSWPSRIPVCLFFALPPPSHPLTPQDPLSISPSTPLGTPFDRFHLPSYNST